MTQNVMNPSRRSVAKGAAWAVPAVAVAATAPSLAASPLAVCDPGTLVVEPVCPDTAIDLIDGTPLYFTITNPDDSGCEVPADTQITVNRGGLLGLDAVTLNSLANVGVAYDSETVAHLSAPLQPGEQAIIHLFPQSLATADVLATASVSIAGSTATQDYTIVSVPLTGTTIAICGTLLDV